jgi:O-antigen/teichoic acid export membrane protein
VAWRSFFTGWGLRVLEFCFFFLGFFFLQVWLQQESILFGLLKVSQHVWSQWLALAASGRQLSVAGSSLCEVAAHGGSMVVAAHLLSQYTVAWRSLPWPRG